MKIRWSTLHKPMIEQVGMFGVFGKKPRAGAQESEKAKCSLIASKNGPLMVELQITLTYNMRLDE